MKLASRPVAFSAICLPVIHVRLGLALTAGVAVGGFLADGVQVLGDQADLGSVAGRRGEPRIERE